MSNTVNSFTSPTRNNDTIGSNLFMMTAGKSSLMQRVSNSPQVFKGADLGNTKGKMMQTNNTIMGSTMAGTTGNMMNTLENTRSSPFRETI